MNDVVDIDAGELWACASPEALQRTADLVRRVMKAPISMVASITDGQHIVRGMSGAEHLAASIPLTGNACAKVVARGQPLIVPDISRDTDGTETPRGVAAYIGTPIRLSSGREIGTLCVMDLQPHDWSFDDLELLTELADFLTSQIELKLEVLLRGKAEKALGAIQARLLAVADRIPGLVFERRKIDASRSSYTFFGSTKTKLPAVRQMMEDGGTASLNFIHRDDREVVRAALLRANLEETDLDLTFRVKDMDGSIRWLRSQSIVRRASNGGIYWDGLCFDISDLVASREDAEAARTAKDAMVVNVNHELRTPLQAIVGFTDFLKSETRPELVAAHATNIQSAAESLLAIVNQLLVQAGSEVPVAAPVELIPFGETCLSMVGPAAIEKRLSSRFEVDLDVPVSVSLDAQKLNQALLNLLNNAVKFTDEGGFVLRISRAANGLRFAVSDTGIGIPDGARELLFQRFSRLAPAEHEADGSGLGLSITKTLVESMDGRIGFESHVDHGTTFWFEIPLRAEPATTPRVAAQPTATRPEMVTQTSNASEGARILLADDLDLNRKLVADMLGMDGHIVDCVADGAEAVKLASERRYDLVLMDMIMPGMDGLAATRAIRALPAPACNVPIVALTANSFQEHLDSCLKAGMDATLTKPMSIDALTHVVSTWTRGRKAA